ncbi:hypothetical protein FHY13_003751 [Xanthomonas arboricola]|uniref:hypothetical protein n=1 Tax=Xanthomonas euroxanthea TaxID=2259622 RepID=UPI001608C1C7|nr:hypothetical protein [Xanthomonas euroxanthea]MBB3815359.1 hypothetical protein [Xanthomonas euroxanthea]
MTKACISTEPSCAIEQLLSQALQRALNARLSTSGSGNSELARSLVMGEPKIAQSFTTGVTQHTTEAIANDALDAGAVIWRVAYLRALAFGALGTPLQNADTAVQVFSKSSHAAVETLSFQNVVWLECYVSALLHHHPIEAKNAADAHLRGVLRHNIRSSGEISH